MRNQLLLLLCILSLCAQAQWQLIGQQIPSTTSGYNDSRVYFVNNNVGYGLFNKTTDGGQTWQLMNGVQGGTNISFTDAQHGHRVHNTISGPPAYERTIDSTNSWQELSTALPTNPYGIYDVFFPSTETGYITNNSRVFKTTDTGSSWVTKYDNSNSPGVSFISHSLHFVTANVGYIGGSHVVNGNWISSDILITRNGGDTWDSVTLPLADGQSPNLFAPDTNNVYAISKYGSTAKIIHSADGGQTWTEQFSDSTKVLWDIFFPTPMVGYVVGTNYAGAGADTGLVLKTTDGGVNWSVQPTDYNKTVRDCHFISSEVGWLAGTGGDVLHTTNGGGTVNAMGELNTTSENIIIYPNPASGLVNIRIAGQHSHAELSIFNSTGQSVKRTAATEGGMVTLDCTDYANGLYVVIFRSEQLLETRTLMVHK